MIRQSTSDLSPRVGSRGLYGRIQRRRIIRRRLGVLAVVALAGGAAFLFTRPQLPLLPHKIPGTSAWATKHYGNPDAPRFREKNIVTIDFLGRQMFVHKKAQRHFLRLESIFQARAPEYAATVVAGALDDWSYHNRTIRGEPTAKSMHAYGLSVDVNALTNVLGTTGDMPAAVVEQWEREGGVWGGDWSRPDPMHFETHLTPAEIRQRYTPTGAPRPWYLKEIVGG
ncbi:MAG TPA: M15 family metallopeptidase [Actinomycetota bacterium]|nr:M15 family metallopeptidase [Actinomycetota bacterium]